MVSSAYWIIGKSYEGWLIGNLWKPCWRALLTMYWSNSAARTKRRGESGSSCLIPLLHLNCLPRTPLRMMEEDPKLRIKRTHCCHKSGKPRCLSIKMMASCSTVSNAFAKSRFKMIIYFLDWWHWCIYSKLQARQFWMVRERINPYWFAWSLISILRREMGL